MFLLLEFEQRITIIQANRVKLFLQVVEELGGILHVSRRINGHKEDTYLVDASRIFNHLHFRYVVCPSGVFQKFCDLTA